MMKKTKMKWAALLVISGSLILNVPAYAFQDVQKQDANWIDSLKQRGIIQGIDKHKFAPQGRLTGAQGLHIIVKALGIKRDSIELPEDFKVNGELTREQFAYMLHQGINATGNYPLIKMYIQVNDEAEGNPAYSGSIQNLLLMKIAKLDEKGNFGPKEKISRIDAARLVYQAAEYVKKYNEVPSKPEQQTEVTLSVEKVSDQVNRIVLTRHDQPHPGYGIAINKIEFTDEGKAIVQYKLLKPDPDKMYPQVISDTKAETYVSSEYKVEIKQAELGKM